VSGNLGQFFENYRSILGRNIFLMQKFLGLNGTATDTPSWKKWQIALNKTPD
jgi:hypothetical protein